MGGNGTEDEGGADAASPDTSVPTGYVLEALLGRGGMGAVYRVQDVRNRRPVALKRLLLQDDGVGAEARRNQRIRELFELEYHTLAELAHPRVIEVYDYGVDAHGPYYTMELLAGSPLSDLAPLPWRVACALVRDAASCLAILHSRRLLHRDVSPGNVLRTADGRAKLIDFGAMSHFGVQRRIVGTPPCLPPEALHLQPLDARSDLFSLGATLYFALTGRHAYPARRPEELRALWAVRPASSAADGAPRALDDLVGALLSTDPQRRPTSAAEVIERLEGIAELEPGDAVDAARAYLTTPTLVGRASALETFDTILARARRGKGGVVYVEAEPGLGRSRLAHAFALQAKLAGATVAHAGASDAAQGPFGMARAWVEELLRVHPTIVTGATVVTGDDPATGHGGPDVSPDLLAAIDRARSAASSDAAEGLVRVQSALCRFVARTALQHRIVLIADDVHAADTASAALLARLASDTGSSHLVIVATASIATHVSDAQRLIAEAATRIPLEPLDAEDTVALVRSLFGETPRVQSMADWMYRQAGGRPRLCMELAEFLLDRGQVRLDGGAWILPEDLEELEVPAAHEQLLAEKLSALSPDARMLAECRALVLDIAPLEVHEYEHLLDGSDARARAATAESELCRTGVFVAAATGFALAQPALRDVLIAGLEARSDGALASRHRTLARVYDARHDERWIASHHLQRAGDTAGALRSLLESGFDLLEVPPHETGAIAPVVEAALDRARHEGRSPREQIDLLTALIGCAANVDRDLSCYAAELLAHLRRDTGLEIWESLDPSLAPDERARRALARAQAAHDAAPETERGLPPGEALTLLGSALASVVVCASRARDTPTIWASARLIEPLSSLSPGAAYQHELLLAAARFSSGLEIGRAYRELAERAHRGVDGIADLFLTHAYLTCGYYDAWMACEFATDDAWVARVADALERAPVYRVQAWQIRFLHHAMRGNAVEMEACRRRIELAAVENPLTNQHATSGLVFELLVAIRQSDLMTLKRLLASLDSQAERFPSWRSTACHAHAEYHFARDELDLARAAAEAGVAASEPGVDPHWGVVLATCLRIMVEQGEAQGACARGRDALETAATIDLRWRIGVTLRFAVALAEVAAGEIEAGLERIRTARRELDAQGYVGDDAVRTLTIAAIHANDEALFERSLAELAELYRPGQHPALLALYERLADRGRRGFATRAGEDRAAAEVAARKRVDHDLRVAMAPEERARRALAILAPTVGRHGWLFSLSADAPHYLGSTDGNPPPHTVEEATRRYFEDETGHLGESTVTMLAGDLPERVEWEIAGAWYEPTMLACRWKGEDALAGIVVFHRPAGSEPGDVSPMLARAVAEHLARTGDTEPISVLDL